MADLEVHLRLEDLLDREKAAILEGRLSDLSRLLHEKEAILTEISSAAHPTPETLRRLKDKSERNQRLLGSVVKGVRSVSARLAAIQGGNSPLNTYTSSGQRQALGTSDVTNMERRA